MTEPYSHDVRVGAVPVRDLAAAYGTPLLALDEDVIRDRCRAAVGALREAPAGSRPLFASKALDLPAVCRIAHQEGLLIDAVSMGEAHVALMAGVPPEDIWLHGNAKTDDELTFALDRGLGRIVLDGHEDIVRLRTMAKARGVRPKVLIRLSLGVEPNTHAYMQTGQIDSKFGFTHDDALSAVAELKDASDLELTGLHTHIGSQILSDRPFLEAAEMMLRFVEDMHAHCGFWPKELNLGGGYGTEDGAGRTMPAMVQAMIAHILDRLRVKVMPLPTLYIEPGRALVDDAGVSVYRVVSIKRIPGVRNYVAVDGGMGDNLRPSLYGARYDAQIVGRSSRGGETFRVVGRYCESGDVLVNHCELKDPAPGDLLAILRTGAYCYPMASTYNRVPRPPVLLVHGPDVDVIARRETLDDLVRLDRLPPHLRP